MSPIFMIVDIARMCSVIVTSLIVMIVDIARMCSVIVMSPIVICDVAKTCSTYDKRQFTELENLGKML